MVRVCLLLLLVACGGEDGNLVASTSFTISEMSGAGPSPLDPLYQQVIGFEVELVAPSTGYDTADPCKVTAQDSEMPVRTATGATADAVQSGILDLLPVWSAKLALCEPADQSTATLESDNEAGLAVIIGCLGLPASAMVRDSSGNPKWSDFTATKCQATVYDQLHGRLFMGHDFSMTIRH